MQKNFLSFDVELTKKFGLKRTAILSYIKLLIILEKFDAKEFEKISTFKILHKTLQFISVKDLLSIGKSMGKFRRNLSVLNYLQCDKEKLANILNNLFRQKRN